MKILEPDERPGGVGIGIALLAVGIAIGAVARPDAWLRAMGVVGDRGTTGVDRNLDRAIELTHPMARGESMPAPVENTLETLYVELDEEASARLQNVRDRSLQRGLIVQEEEDTVRATIRLGGKSVDARVRIKGDFVDHVQTQKWSLRIELKGDKLMGMSRFSIQHPKTRGYLWEWLVLKAARRDGLLAPRSTFVNVVMNDNDVGVFYLEEHFTKELLESQGRREGPIVRMNDRLRFDAIEQHKMQQAFVPPSILPATRADMSEVSAYGEKRLAQSENMARQLQEALDQLEFVQDWMRGNVKGLGASGPARLQARLDQAEKTIDDVLDVDDAARYHALMALFRTAHGLGAKDRRFYHNPVTGRLEVVVWDTRAGVPIADRDPVAMRTHVNTAFLSSPSYHNRLFAHVASYSHPDYLNGLFLEVEEDLRRFSGILTAEGMSDPGLDIEEIEFQLWDQQVFLRELVRPRNGVNFDCRLLSRGDNHGDIVVEAWATTRIPVLLRGFRFSNGRFLAAADVLDPLSTGTSRLAGEEGAVVLPHDGRRAELRFSSDIRLASLRDVEEAKQAAATGSEADRSFKLRLTASYRYIGEAEPRDELLWIRRFAPDWAAEGGRPPSPELGRALKAHRFLSFDEEERVLRIEPGEWEVEGDLVVPDGHPVHAGPGVTLLFAEGKGIVSSEPLRFEGTSDAPVRLLPRYGAESWGGVCVLQARASSTWKFVEVHDTDVLRRGGWMMTGGVTFYRSRIDLFDCRFENAHGEDALNIYGTEFVMERCVIDTCASDAYDGDFVTGTLRDCSFSGSVEDAIDFSGSEIDVYGCRFVDIGDKGISAGENTTLRAYGCVVESANIAAASKDSSRLEIDGLDIRRAELYGLAAYVKKPEFGASTIVAENVTMGTVGLGPHIVQEGCKVSLNGVEIEGQPLDVKELYRQKILGQ